jgi:hypothetical protein
MVSLFGRRCFTVLQHDFLLGTYLASVFCKLLWNAVGVLPFYKSVSLSALLVLAACRTHTAVPVPAWFGLQSVPKTSSASD